MSDEVSWLSVPDFADAWGVSASDVRDALRTGALVAVRRGENDAWHLPAGFLEEHEGQVRVLPTLVGTLTLLRDNGFSDEEIVAWLLEFHEELGASPLGALREGRRAPVRRVAQTLL
ncbi:Rv2175c family DNA-binding protein [Demequina sp. NBRC 110057]|uniref:Rv2175c family DNA-binding protein n=1 Tax=Demequina sp. NBRC 110057 TaxID=1570346 RepID=UPI001EEED6BC|nr:Rv2175c family DNA-binding protein [Demequina sp. NBRC 110057]